MCDSYHISLTDSPDPDLMRAVREGLDTFNAEHGAPMNFQPLCLFVRDEPTVLLLKHPTEPEGDQVAGRGTAVGRAAQRVLKATGEWEALLERTKDARAKVSLLGTVNEAAQAVERSRRQLARLVREVARGARTSTSTPTPTATSTSAPISTPARRSPLR